MLGLELDRPHLGASPAWGQMLGEVALPAESPQVDPATRTRLEELGRRFCWALDERRADILRGCLCEDAVWEGSVAGSHALGPVAGRERLLSWWMAGWSLDSGQTRHLLLGTVLGEVDDSRATTFSHLLLTSSLQDRVRSLCPGFVRLDLSRQAEAWSIARIFHGYDVPPWDGRAEQLSERMRRRFGLPEGVSADA